MKIVIDAFGGDYAPTEIIKGSVQALNEDKELKIVFTGDKERIEKELKDLNYAGDQVEIVHATEVITNDDVPTVAIKKKEDSSLVKGFKVVKEDSEAGAFISAGSTGALLVGSLLKIGRIRGISRPALAALLPTKIENKQVLLLDSGANTDCKPINLCHFAVLGSIYMQTMGIENPKVALLSNGTEEGKGNELTKTVGEQLSKIECINYCGNLEARDILTGDVDVVVADGFSGNVALKGIEGASSLVLGVMKELISSSAMAKVGYLFMKKQMKEMKNRLDYKKLGGAPFLGIDRIIVKAHGSAKAETIYYTIKQVKTMIKNNLTARVKEELSKINLSELEG